MKRRKAENMQQILTYTFLVFYTVTILGIILVIITENRNPLKTLPWIIVLVLAPVVGLVFYFFFGQNLSQAAHHFAPHPQSASPCSSKRPATPGGPKFRRSTAGWPRCCTARPTPSRSTAAASPPTPTAARRWKPCWRRIARAKHHIHIQYYILCDDETGRRLRDALVAKARRASGFASSTTT